MKKYAPFRPIRACMWFLMFSAVFAAGCGKKPPIAPPPPPPAATTKPAPTTPGTPTIASFEVEPSSIERGQSAVVRWSVSNATAIAIDQGIGTVDASGSRRVVPAETTTYTLTAGGPGGNVTAAATVTVTAPAPPPPPPATANKGTFDARVQSD